MSPGPDAPASTWVAVDDVARKGRTETSNLMDHQVHSHSKWLTVSEVADSLRVSRETVIRWVRSGSLAAVDISTDSKRPHQRTHWRISQESLSQFLENRSVQPPQRKRRRPPFLRQPDVVEFIK